MSTQKAEGPRGGGGGGGRDKTQPTPTELLALADRWDGNAVECETHANQIGDKHSAYNELLRDAAQYRQSAYQLRTTLTTLSAREDGWQLLIDAAKQAERRLTYLNIQDGKSIDADLVLLLRKALAGTSAPKAPTAGEGA